MSGVTLFVILTSCMLTSYAADILILSTTTSTSHSLWFQKMALLLANNGHQVVLLDTDPLMVKHDNITQKLITSKYNWLNEMETMIRDNPEALDSIVGGFSIMDVLIMIAFTDTDMMGCYSLLQSDEVKHFMNEYKGKKFDLIISDTFCENFYGFVDFFGNIPIIPMIPHSYLISDSYVGQFDNPSFVPEQMSNCGDKMNFIERAINTFVHYYFRFFVGLRYHERLNRECQQVFGSSTRHLKTILRDNVQLMMSGYHPVLHGARPLSPALINIPGFHIDPLKPLPQDIKKFIDEAKDGAILFSMGSNFKSILMSPEKREMFLSVFRNIPQRVIWKLELDNDTNIPHNVMIKKWLPQSDILGHPNIKAFISHGGSLGTEEAVHYGVPIIGLPLMFDQVRNLMILEKEGVAIKLHYKDLNTETIAQQIDKIINDKSYINNMKKYSAAYRDVPQSPRDKALFWIEHTLRNSKSTKNYLKPLSASMPWYQTFLIDVIAFYIACLLIVYWIIKNTLAIIFSICCRRKSNNRKPTTKDKKNK